MPFTAVILTATVSFHPNEGFVWEQLDRYAQLPVHRSLITANHVERRLASCATSQDFKEKRGFCPKGVYHGFAKPKSSKKSQIKPTQNHEIHLLRCFIQQPLNRKKMVKYFKGLGFNTSQMILKSPSQLCQHLERVF